MSITSKFNGLHRSFYVVLLLRTRLKEMTEDIYQQVKIKN